MDDDTITVVSGLPRSGTSMMMNMLEKGGILPLTDQERGPNVDNPKGYYEYERVKDLPEDTGWLDKAEGKTVKVLAELVKHLPDGYDYKIIFMQRHLKEIIESQKKMLERRGEDPEKVSDEELMAMFKKYKQMLKKQIEESPNMEVLYVSYNAIMEDPEGNVERVNEFLTGDLDKEAMLSVIDEDLYRNRAVE